MKKSYATYSKFRDAKGVTDYRVAEDCGIPRSTISDWKSGISVPRADKLLVIANYLDIPVEKIIERRKKRKVVNTNAKKER